MRRLLDYRRSPSIIFAAEFGANGFEPLPQPLKVGMFGNHYLCCKTEPLLMIRAEFYMDRAALFANHLRRLPSSVLGREVKEELYGMGLFELRTGPFQLVQDEL